VGAQSRKSPESQSRHRALAAVLTTARQEVGLSQRQLAARLARARSFVFKIESGQQELKVWEFLEYADALQMDPADLLRRLVAVAAAAPNAEKLDP
jgi:ribosome-binding protein aMBF1 (putative translation factor)